MTQARNWLKARAPGFNNLSKKEQDAITDFSLLWGFFSASVLPDCTVPRSRWLITDKVWSQSLSVG